VDHTKFGKQAFVHVGPVTDFTTIITDSGADPDQIAGLREAGVEVIVVNVDKQVANRQTQPPLGEPRGGWLRLGGNYSATGASATGATASAGSADVSAAASSTTTSAATVTLMCATTSRYSLMGTS
jgi:hypothetical protein